VPGHWEGDLLSGSGNSYIVTLVERHTRYVMLAKIPSRDTQTVVSALIKQAKKLPDELYKSLTWDRGNELTDHKRFTMATNIAVYFCDPQSPWQRTGWFYYTCVHDEGNPPQTGLIVGLIAAVPIHFLLRSQLLKSIWDALQTVAWLRKR
jgi:hypothetical protein